MPDALTPSKLFSLARWLIDSLTEIPPEERHVYFARGFVPGLAAAMAALIYFGQFAQVLEDQITVVSLHSRFTQSSLADRNGFLVLANIAADSPETHLGIGWENEAPLEIWTSLETRALKPNLSQISWTPFGLDFPLGIARGNGPFVLGADVRLSSHISLGGRSIGIENFYPRPSGLEPLAMVATLVATFSVGFTMKT